MHPLKWHGGKSYLASWILSCFPHRSSYTHYLEPYAGGLSVLFKHNPEGKSETINDLNGDLTNFWKVLSLSPDLLFKVLSVTPFSENVWREAKTSIASDPVLRAVDFFVRYRQSRQGLAEDFATPTKRTRRGMNENVSAWLTAVEGLPEAARRLKRVEIRNLKAIDFIRRYDHPKALFYLDPPYLHSTRTAKNAYEFEMTEEEHEELLLTLQEIQGQFLLSGYPSELYQTWADDNQYSRHERIIDNKSSAKLLEDKESGKTSKEKKTECLWFNFPPPPNASGA